MAQKISQQVLDDFMATLATNPNADRKQLMQAFPEFGNDERLLEAAYDYRETRLQNPMADMQTINSKFPEFFAPEPPVQEPMQQTNPSVAANPAPTTEEEYQANLQRQWEGEPQYTVPNNQQTTPSNFRTVDTSQPVLDPNAGQREVFIMGEPDEQRRQQLEAYERKRAANMPQMKQMWANDEKRFDEILAEAETQGAQAAGQVASEYGNAYQYAGMPGGTRLAMRGEMQAAANRETDPDKIAGQMMDEILARYEKQQEIETKRLIREGLSAKEENANLSEDEMNQLVNQTYDNIKSQPIEQLQQQAGVDDSDMAIYAEYVQEQMRNRFMDKYTPKDNWEYFARKVAEGNLLGQAVGAMIETPAQRAYKMQGTQRYANGHNTTWLDLGAEATNIVTDPTMYFFPAAGHAAANFGVRKLATSALTRKGIPYAAQVAERQLLQRGSWNAASRLLGGSLGFMGIDVAHDIANQMYMPVYNEKTGKYEEGAYDAMQTVGAAGKGAAMGAAFGLGGLMGDAVQRSVGQAYGKTIGAVAGKGTHYAMGTNLMFGSDVMSQIAQGTPVEDIDFGEAYRHAAMTQLFFDLWGGAKQFSANRNIRQKDGSVQHLSFRDAVRLGWNQTKDPYSERFTFTNEELEQLNKYINGGNNQEILLNLNSKGRTGNEDWLNDFYKQLNAVFTDPEVDTQTKYKLAYLLSGEDVRGNVRPIHVGGVEDVGGGKYQVRTYDNSAQTYSTRRFNSLADARRYEAEQQDITKTNKMYWLEGIAATYGFAKAFDGLTNETIEKTMQNYPQLTEADARRILTTAKEELSPVERAIKGRMESYLSKEVKGQEFVKFLRQELATKNGISEQEVNNILSKEYSELNRVEKAIFDDYLDRLTQEMPLEKEVREQKRAIEAGGGIPAEPVEPTQPTREDVIRQEVTDEVALQTHKNGYVYPVKQAGESGKTGFVVGGEVVVDTTDPSKPRISNDDIVTVKYEDGTIEQVSARMLDLVSTPEPADNVINGMVEQRLAAEAQQEVAEQAVAQNLPEGVVEFTNGEQTLLVKDNGNGTYQLLNSDGTLNVNSMTADQLAQNGYAMIPREQKPQAPVQQLSEQPTEQQAPEPPIQPVVTKPVVPNAQTMSSDELGASTVEYLGGDRQTAKAYLTAELDKAKKMLNAVNKQQVRNFNGIEDFKRQNDTLNAQKQAAQQMVTKLEGALLAAASYKTQAELQEEAERKAREAALREQRRQLAEAETAGDIETKWQNTKKTVGFAATKTLPNGQKVNGHYILTEAGDVVPSHDPRKNYADSEGYVMENGQNVNDNNYKDPDVQRIALDIAQNYGGQAVEQMPFLENRAGRVLSGNNRTISGIIAAENNTDQAYLAALAENAQQYGFTPEQLTEYQHPRLQFVVEDELPFTTGTFAMFNQQEKKTKSSVNRAIANSKMVTEAVRDKMLEVMDQYDSLDSFFGSENAAADIVQSLISEGLMTQQEVAGLTESTGTGFKFSQSGREYVTDMLLGTLFDEQTIRMLAGEKTLKQAILRALPSIVENRRLKGYELTESINKAVQILYEARKANEGKSTADAFQLFLHQVDAFEGKVTDRFDGFDIILANRMSAGVEQLREMLNLYNNSARDEANGQMGFFESRSSEDIKQDVYEYYTKQQPDLAAALNGAAEEGSQSQSPVSSGTADAGEVRPTQREQLTEYLNGIADEEHKPILFDNSTLVETLRNIGATPDAIAEAQSLVVNGGHIEGFYLNGYVCLNIDNLPDAERARTKYVHERQHDLTRKDIKRVKEVVDVASESELKSLLEKFSNSPFYNKQKHSIVADEFISFAMEEAYKAKDDAELESALRAFGVKDELIDIIKSINNEQRGIEAFAMARRNAPDNHSAESSSRESSADSGTQSGGGLGREGSDADQQSLRRTEGGGDGVPAAGEVTDKIVPERPNSKQLQGMSYNVAEAEDYIGRVVRNILDENGYNDVEIVGTKVIGSRVNGNAREDSDLDAIVEFKGDAREDSLFNLFAGENIELDGVKVDVNPITEGKSGTIEQFMRRSDEYLAEKNAETEIGGALVDRLEDMGVSVSTDLQANRDALKAAKADKSEAGAIHYYKTPSGQQYGFSYKGKVYLDPTKINAELPLHEYGHLWAEALRRLNPENWQRVVETIKADKEAWAFVRELRPELTDENEIAEEVIATFSGKKGAERLKAEYDRMHGKDADYKSKWGNIFKNISKAIQDFWKAVGDFLNIKYESAEQVYDQVLKDFVDNMNPWKRVSDFLRQRDAEYVQAAESGDIKTATNIFYDALKENIGNGITPYMSVGTYNNLKRLAKGVKTRDAALIKEAADLIAPLIPDNAVLIPAPSHSGTATDMLDLAKAIAEVTGSEVADVLRSAPRESQYQAKKTTGVPMASKQLGIAVEGDIPADKTPIIIDNVVDSGNTAEACVQAVGKGVVVTLADSAEQYGHAASLKSAAPVLRDKDGKVIPLSKRFDLSGSRYLGRRMYLRPDDLRLSVSGTQTIPVGKNTLVGLHNISAEKLRKAIKMGGLANPSAAVIDLAKQDHHNYGDISLVMPSSLVDSETGRNAGTYAGDAYTPTYPGVEFRAGKDTAKKIEALTKGLPKVLDDAIQRHIRDYMDGNTYNSGLEYLFLKERGQELPIEHTPRRYPYITIEEIYKRLGMEYPGYYDSSSYAKYEAIPEDQLAEFNLWLQNAGNQEEIDKRKANIARMRSEGKDNFANTLESKWKERMSFANYDSTLYRIMNDGSHAGEENPGMTLDKAKDLVETQGLRPEFEEWMQAKIDDLGYTEVLFDGWTPSGNRRLLPNTLENASKIMNRQDQTNYREGVSVSETKSMLMDKFRTLAQIRKHKDILEPDEEKIKEAYEAVSDDWLQLGVDFRDYTKADGHAYGLDDNPYTAIDTALYRIQEAMFKRDPIAWLNKEYRYSIPADNEWLGRIMDLKQRITNLPARYFETKFRRPVYLDEFRNAVVPNDLPQDLRDGLEKAGLTLFEYDPKEEGARRAATLQATEDEGIRFSVSGGLDTDRTLTKAAREEMQQIKDAALADGTFMKAPNGKRSNLNERQWLQVRTRAFKRWFGDWENDPENASKVLDENGEPMVAKHGTPFTFTTFDKSKQQQNDAGWLGRGFYFFTKNDDYAAGYARGGQVINAFLNIKDPYYATYADMERLAEMDSKEESERFTKGLIDEGYDGVYFDANLNGEWVAFEPNQIKSATDNNGDFSEENDDIRFSISNQNNDIFYSNAERAVEGIKQEKATPEQWRAMIEKAGGLKAGEDKWIGLSDWLAQQRPTVTPQEGETRSQFVERAAAENKRFTLSKQDLLDYIREHKIQIEEQEYGKYEEDALFLERKDEFKRYYDEAVEAGEEDPNEVAWDRMIEEYGDDFSLGYYAVGDELMRDNDSDYAQWEADSEGRPRNINETRLEYTTKGLDNKREIALVVPTIESWNESDEVHFGDAGEGRAIAWVRFGDAKTISKPEELVQAEQEYKEFSRKMIGQYGLTYTERVMSDSERQQESDLIAKLNQARKDHPQVEEKVLVIDEIQSKRHQEGREYGYVNSETAIKYRQLEKETSKAQLEYHDYRDQLWKKYENQVRTRGEMLDVLTPEEKSKHTELQEKYENLYDRWEEFKKNIPANAIPAAPFEKNWHELAMKRILRFAAENGYDKVAWTTGDQQARRYDLSKVIESIELEHVGNNGRKMFRLKGLDYKIITEPDGKIYAGQEEFVGKNLSDVVGKDVAKRMLEMNEGDIMEGDDLRIGGEGMRGFYDDILPRFMQKYGKKWGVHVGEVTMPQLEDGYQTMHAIDINDAMRESVMEGQPMFSITGSRGAANIDQMEGVTTRMDNLAAARRMEEDGKDAKTIRMATGWERGADGKWRYEIDDVQLNADNVKANFRKLDRRGVTAPMVWYHNKFTDIIADSPERKQLLAAYPQLADLDIEFYDYPNKERGAYSSEKKKISINRANVRSVDECRSVLLHEIQHAIQEAELFAKGTSKEQIQLTWKLNNEVHNKVDEYFDKMGFKEWLTSHNGDKAFVDRLTQVIHMFPNRDFNIHYLFVETLPRDKQIDAIDVLGDANDVIQSNRDAIYGADRKGMTMKPDELYHNAAGEVESRNVQNRMNLTPEERRERLLAETEDVAREDQVVIMNAFDMENDDATPRSTMDAQPGENKVQYAARIAEEIKRENPKDTSLDEAIRFSITVNHNSPYLLKRADGAFVDPETGERLGFDLRFIGKGEGGQAHGWGSYFSVNDIRSYGEGYGFSLRDIKDAFNTSRWQSFGVGDAFDVAKGYLLEAHSEKAPSLRKWLEDRLAQKQELLKSYEGKVANTAEEDLMVFRAEADVQYIPALLRDMVNDIDTRNRHHYDVEIPDNDGTNYIDEDKPMDDVQMAILRNEIEKEILRLDQEQYIRERDYFGNIGAKAEWAGHENDIVDYLLKQFPNGMKGRDLYYNVKAILHKYHPYDEDKEASEFLNRIGFVGIHYDGRRDGECYVIFTPDDAVITDHIRFSVTGGSNFADRKTALFPEKNYTFSTTKTTPIANEDDQIRFSVNNPSTLSRSETVTKALVQQANNNYNIMQSALKKVTADLKGIRAAMRMQSDYDRKVVDALLNLYNTLLQENGVWAQYMPDTTRRIATQIVHSIGKQNITEEVNTIMDHMVHAQAKAAQRQWDKLRQTPIDKINISGVVMQGKVALEGQHALKAMNDALQANMTIEQIEEQINQLMDMEDNATDESLKTQYKGQWIGLTIAAQHLERLQHLQEERQQLDLELQSARSNKALKPAARQQLVDNIKQAMRDNYIEQAEAYTRSTQDLSEYVNTQEGRAKDFIRRQDANRDKIRSYAQRDLEGLATNPNRNRTRGNVARSIWDAFASPIRDLQSLLRLTGLHAPDGEGYLYNHFMRNWMDGADMERTGIVAASKTLDEKIAELTHGKYKTWEEAARKINDASHNKFSVMSSNGVDGKDQPVIEEIPLNAGNALYIYAVNKQIDGKMKLSSHNITDEDVKALTDKVREQFGQEILDVVDWVQSEYFSQLRNRYNPTHEALFGAPMDAVENYFPLRLNPLERQQNEDLSEPDTDAARLLAGTSTGSIKRRKRNSIGIDIRNADFFQEVIRHISQMERWNAFAQWNRDANILFSDINFRNRIKGMKGTIYGEGDKLYNYMKDAFRVAIGTYKPNADGFSKEILNAAKGVTSAKINFRVFTALKQIASFPAFFTYMQDGTFVTSYLRNWLTPHSTMKWAKENLPNFEKRVSKRDLGDMRLMSRSTDWQWNKRILEWSSKYGMFFNVFFDTLTCATGARAVYDSHLADYLKKGYSEEDARNRARQDAEQAFNTSQQSSEGAFMAPIQMDRNAVTAALTVFRTSPMQYTRNFFFHVRGLLRKIGEGKRDEQIAFRMGQYKNDGLNDEQARKAAEKDYNKSIRADVTGVVVYGALLGILWRLVGSFPYLFFGDDDDKKKQIVMDAVTGGAFVQPITGLIGGSYIESALDGNGLISSMFAPELPFTQDAKRAEQYLQNNKYAEFASQALSVLMQSTTGFDPQTAADMIQRIVTTIDSEEELSAAEEAIRISQALLSIPQSQYEQQLVDRVVADESEYDAALADYIRYQKVHTAPLTWWLRSEESDEKAEENAERRFDRLLNERDELHNPEEE